MFEEKPINSLSMIWADSAYRRAYLKEALASRKIELSIVGGGLKEGFWVPKDQIMNFEIPPKKFQVQPRRWVVERTFAWLNRNRRLSKDYEYLTDVSVSYLYLGMSRILLRRLIKK
jgi:transposase